MKTFLLMLASAFGGILLFVAAVAGYFSWQSSRVAPGESVYFPPRNEKRVDAAPPLSAVERFHGTSAMMAGEFTQAARQTVLSAGPGKIVGNVTSSGRPVQGLRLRLALNGAVMSEWATTGADGRYEIALPYGKYRIDGYELDSSTTRSVLAGKTDVPEQGFHQPELVTVEDGKPARGLDLAYVDPVRKLGPSGEIKAAQPPTVSWQPYPGAKAYRLQLVERKSPRDFASERRMFDWRSRPIVSGTSLNLAEHSIVLKQGHHYIVEIEALDERDNALAQSPSNLGRPDFQVVE